MYVTIRMGTCLKDATVLKVKIELKRLLEQAVYSAGTHAHLLKTDYKGRRLRRVQRVLTMLYTVSIGMRSCRKVYHKDKKLTMLKENLFFLVRWWGRVVVFLSGFFCCSVIELSERILLEKALFRLEGLLQYACVS